jgi:RNase H-like domain found in reverse transcriptase
MLQTIVNVRNFKNCAWDSPICLDYVLLYCHAYDELLYWRSNLELKNFNPFADPQPSWVGWSDASDIAVGGCLIQLSPGQIITPCTVDNILLRPDLGYDTIRRCAGLQADLMPWSHTGSIVVRDELDVNVGSTVEMLFCHRNFTPSESATSSTERELSAIYYFVVTFGPKIKGSKVTLYRYSDSQNAVTICSKGSGKPRLHAYAKLIYDILETWNIDLTVLGIPRDLNNVADTMSALVDYADYEIAPEGFELICDTLKVRPDTDLFANSVNRKCNVFFSAVFCPETAGVDAFQYNWSQLGLCWIFVPPSFVGRVLSYAKTCKAHILLLVPQWKYSFFLPVAFRFAKNGGFCCCFLF